LNNEFVLNTIHIQFHRLTDLHKEATLRVDLESFDGKTAWAEYTEFK
jgi:hypothetical protein